MKNRKKVVVIGAAILALAVVGFGVTKASGLKAAWGSGFHSCFHGMGPRSESHSADMADWVMWKMDRHVKDLNLNEIQTREYEKVKEEIKTSILDAHQRRNEFRHMVRLEMEKENPDMNGLASLIKGRVNHVPDLISEKIDLFLNFYNVLDRDQKARVIEMIRLRMGSAKQQN